MDIAITADLFIARKQNRGKGAPPYRVKVDGVERDDN